jgi:hypothetical protein
MKIVTYKQLCKEPVNTIFATLNKMNEMGELFVIKENEDGCQLLYSPLGDAAKTGTEEIEFASNCFNRKDGAFVVFTKEELEAYVSKLMGIIAPQVQSFVDKVVDAVAQNTEAAEG